MTKRTGTNQAKPKERKNRLLAPGRSIQAREDQLIMLGYDLLEERLRSKTATSQELSLVIKAGSTMAQLEKARLEKENRLLEAKTRELESRKRTEELLSDALAALTTYQGKKGSTDDD